MAAADHRRGADVNTKAQDPKERMLRLAAALSAGDKVTSAYIRDRFGVSKATAKRDLYLLESVLPVAASKGSFKQLRLERA